MKRKKGGVNTARLSDLTHPPGCVSIEAARTSRPAHPPTRSSRTLRGASPLKRRDELTVAHDAAPLTHPPGCVSIEAR